MTINNVLKILLKNINAQQVQKYGLDEISFDVVQNTIFPKLELSEIMNVCLINKNYYQQCRQSDLFWQNYIRQHYNITYKPDKYQTWFDLLNAIFKARDYFLEVRGTKVVPLGYYIQYTNDLRINSKYELEIKLKAKEGYKSTQINGIKRVAILYLQNRPKLVVATDLNDNLVIYHYYGGIDYEYQDKFIGSGKALQIINYNKKGCWVLTENKLYDVSVISVKEVKIPTKFKYISSYTYSGESKKIVAIDLEGKVWLRGANFRLGNQHITGNKFILISNSSHPATTEAVLNSYSGEYYLSALDQSGYLWMMGDLDDIIGGVHQTLTKINTLREYDRSRNNLRRSRVNNKFKLITSSRLGNNLVITDQNEILILEGLEGRYIDTKIRLENYFNLAFENVGMISQGIYISSKKL